MTKGKKIKIFFLIAISFFIAGIIGYAYLHDTLTINGDATVTKSTWNVKFTTITPIKNTGTLVSAPTVTNYTQLRFSELLSTPGDEYIFTVVVANEGSIDAMLSDTPTLSGLEDMSDYLEYRVSYSDGASIEKYDLLSKNSTDTIKVVLRFKKDITEADLAGLSSSNVTKTMLLSMTYVQANNKAKARDVLIGLPEGKNKNTLAIGDEIRIDNELFNFLKYDGDNVVMLAKYNLNVGNNPKKAATGIQDKNVRGWLSSGAKYGNVAFSYSNYWDGEVGTTSEYIYQGAYSNPNYPYVYDDEYKTAPDFSSTCDNSTNCYYTEVI